MGKKSRSRQAASAGSSAAARAAPAGGSTQGASAQAFPGSEADISARLGEHLVSIRCRPVLQRLEASGYSEHVAQRACLEVHQARHEMSYESCVKWIRRHDLSEIDRPVQPLELLRYLPFMQAVALLQRLDLATLCGLTADEVAEGDLGALLRTLGAAEACGTAARTSPAVAAPAAVAVPAPAVGHGPATAQDSISGSGGGSTSGSAGGGSSAAAAAAATGATEQPTSGACDKQAGTGSSGGGGGFTERVTQQVLGLQQHMSKALASLRRSSSGSSSSGSRPAGTASSAEDAGAATAAATAVPVQGAHAEQAVAGAAGGPGQQSNEEQLGALRDMLGPGVEVCTAEEFKQQNPGADYEALPSLDLQTLPERPAAPAGACKTPAAVGATTADLEPQALAAELASLRAHREWADTRIAQLIRRAGDAERPLREEAARLCQVVQSLRGENEGMKRRLRELERSISCIKESSDLEEQQRRELELRAAVAAAELKAASLREQEAAAEAASLQKQLAQERRRREAAEQRCKRTATDAATAAAAAATAAEREMDGLRQQLRCAQQAAERQRLTAERAQAAAVGEQTQALAAARAECQVLDAEKASLAAELEEAQQQAQRAQLQAHLEAEQGLASMRAELESARQGAAAAGAAAEELREQLAAARAAAAAADARAAAACAAAEAAQQRAALAGTPGPALSRPDTLPLQPALAGAPAAHAITEAPTSLFGSHLGAWSMGLGAVSRCADGNHSSSGGGSLFCSTGRLDGGQAAAKAATLHPGAPLPLLYECGLGLAGSGSAPGSPSSHTGSGSMTPPCSLHSSSIAASPTEAPASLALLAGSSGAGWAAISGAAGSASGGLFACGVTGGGAASVNSLFGGGPPTMFPPEPAGIWSTHGPAGLGGLPLFAAHQR